jgi:hypothetical protein
MTLEKSYAFGEKIRALHAQGLNLDEIAQALGVVDLLTIGQHLPEDLHAVVLEPPSRLQSFCRLARIFGAIAERWQASPPSLAEAVDVSLALDTALGRWENWCDEGEMLSGIPELLSDHLRDILLSIMKQR